MGEKTGFMTVLFIFGAFILPLLLRVYIDNVHTQQLLTVSTEMQQLVSAEGGVTERVQNVANQLKEKGLTITFKDENGNPVAGKVPVGKQIIMDYQYNGFKTSNSTIILKRNTD